MALKIKKSGLYNDENSSLKSLLRALKCISNFRPYNIWLLMDREIKLECFIKLMFLTDKQKNFLKKLWRIIAFLARIINTIEDVYYDIKNTFSDDEKEKEREK